LVSHSGSVYESGSPSGVEEHGGECASGGGEHGPDVIDDIGLLPVTTETAEALYRVVDAAYEKRCIALSSNLHPAGFDELVPKTIANATVDRLMHQAHVVLTAGDNIRLTQARGDAPDPMNHGQNPWPPLGSPVGHERAGPLSVNGDGH
jgi:hypothetical protein